MCHWDRCWAGGEEWPGCPLVPPEWLWAVPLGCQAPLWVRTHVPSAQGPAKDSGQRRQPPLVVPQPRWEQQPLCASRIAVHWLLQKRPTVPAFLVAAWSRDSSGAATKPKPLQSVLLWGSALSTHTCPDSWRRALPPCGARTTAATPRGGAALVGSTGGSEELPQHSRQRGSSSLAGPGNHVYTVLQL